MVDLAVNHGLISVTVSGVLSVLCILASLLFYSRRSYQPIRSRLWHQPILISFLLVLSSNFFSIVGEFYLSYQLFCYAFAFFTLPIVMLVLRAAHVFSTYELASLYADKAQYNMERYNALHDGETAATDESSRTGETIIPTTKEPGFFVKYAQLIGNGKFQAFVCIVNTIVQFAYWTGFSTLFPEASVWEEVISVSIVMTLYLGPAIYLGKNIRTLKDGLYLKLELVMLSRVGAVMGPTMLISRILTTFHVTAMLLGSLPFIMVFITLGLPLYKSFQWQRVVREAWESASSVGTWTAVDGKSDAGFTSVATLLTGTVDYDAQNAQHNTGVTANKERPQGLKKKVGLKEVLDDENGFQAFLTFCKLELSHENVLFYKEARNFIAYRSKLSEQEVADAIKRIFETYLDHDATLQLNISGNVAELLERACIDTTAIDRDEFSTALKAAASEVFLLMRADPFVRFCRHESGKQYMEDRKARLGQV